MTFFVTFVALLIERFFDWSHLQRWNWYCRYERAVAKRFSGKSPYVALIVVLLPLLAIVGFLQWGLRDVWFGFGEIFFQLAILLYCLGPQNLWADTFACLNALQQDDTPLAAEKLKTTFGIKNGKSPRAMYEQLLHQIFISANSRIFAVIFWFMLLGPVGAVLYRAITLSSADYAGQKVSSDLIHPAQVVESWLDWIPVRLFTGVFALGGHFVQVFSCWRKNAMRGFDINDQLLVDCGVAALGKEDVGSLAEDAKAGKQAIGLLDRTLVISLVLAAIIGVF